MRSEEFEKNLKTGESIDTEFKSWIKAPKACLKNIYCLKTEGRNREH